MIGKVVLNGTAMALAVLFCATQSSAQTPEEKGRAIADEADRRDTGFQDQTSELEMTLRNRHGQESTRYFRLKTLEQEDDGDKSLSIFDQPKDIKGTALLTFTHKDGDDDQWLYLPALKRVKRISSSNQSGPFMGSEFAFEDLSSDEVEKYTYKFIGEETHGGQKCFVIERDPVHPKSGYTRQVVWIDQEHYRTLKIEYYDRKNDLLKTLAFADYAQYLDKFWRASTMNMVNHQSGKTTSLKWKNIAFRTGLNDRDFDRNSLARAR